MEARDAKAERTATDIEDLRPRKVKVSGRRSQKLSTKERSEREEGETGSSSGWATLAQQNYRCIEKKYQQELGEFGLLLKPTNYFGHFFYQSNSGKQFTWTPNSPWKKDLAEGSD